MFIIISPLTNLNYGGKRKTTPSLEKGGNTIMKWFRYPQHKPSEGQWINIVSFFDAAWQFDVSSVRYFEKDVPLMCGNWWSPLLDLSVIALIEKQLLNALLSPITDTVIDIDPLASENEKLRNKIEAMESALERIENWVKAYPLGIFPEPNFERVRELLEMGGITLDCVSASNMRLVLNGIKEIIETSRTTKDWKETG
jgi:hypothetical protein